MRTSGVAGLSYHVWAVIVTTSSGIGPMREVCDVIVVGAGLGGLSAAALLAKAGLDVLVIDRQDGPGGYAHTFSRDGRLFDPAIHVIVEAQSGRTVDLLLRHLGVRDHCDLVRLPDIYRTALPGFELTVPSGHEEIVEAHARRFPEHREEIQAFFDLHARFFRDAMHMSTQVSLQSLDDAVRQFPTFFRYRSLTLGAVLDECFSDPQLKTVCSSMWPYLGLPPSRLSFFVFSQLMSVLVDAGSYYSRGSFQRLADALVDAIERDGGEVTFGTEVARITVDDGRVRGVGLADGREVRAPVVVSNADARLTFEQLVGPEHLPPRFLRRLQRLEPALSAYVLYAATDLDLAAMDATHETFVYRHWDHEDTYSDMLAGRPGGMWVNVPTVTDPSLAPEGEHLLILTALAPYDIGRPWAQEKARFTESVMTDLDRLYPGVSARLTFAEAATPETLQQRTRNHQGATYGWAVTPDQVGSKRLRHDTPVEGLYLSGHWTQEGPSSFRVLLSGITTARMVAQNKMLPDDAVPSFRPEEFPDLVR
jgi:phytoene desaturase